MELLIIIAIIAYIIKATKASNTEMQKNQNTQQPTYQMPKQATRTTSPRAQVQQQNADWQKAVQENIVKARQLATQKLNEFERDVIAELNKSFSEEEPKVQTQPKSNAMQQVHAGRVEANTTTITARAKANADENKVDVTLETMEAEHNHSERVSAAVHHHPEDVLPESMLGSVEDLMVKGFDGNLCFERDFVGEGLDMISRFSYQ